MDLNQLDVLVVGAGVAGLAALRVLDRAGLNVLCVEARDRIGGRILTVHDPLCPLPIELGAEFIHGRPPEIGEIVSAAPLASYDCAEHSVYLEHGVVSGHEDAWLQVGAVMKDLQPAGQRALDDPRHDVSFAEFLAQTGHSQEAKARATGYVEGFNAARAEVIGIASLAQDGMAGDAIEGHCASRIANGYDAVPRFLAQSVARPDRQIRLHCVVERIVWRQQSAVVHVKSNLTGELSQFCARRIIVTVPLGVLQAETGEGVIAFDPQPTEILQAARRLAFGDVFRVLLLFRERLWDEKPELADAGFVLSSGNTFPTWWTPLPFRTPMMTGWSAGPKADPLLGKTQAEVVAHALERLASITGLEHQRLHASFSHAYFHDWQADPYARGSYSYTPAGNLDARRVLAAPVEDTLFFAGEASETDGYSATVHGAIRTGLRAARQVIASLGRS